MIYLVGFEYAARGNQGFVVPDEPYQRFDSRYRYMSISGKSRGRLRSVIERVFNHCHTRQGLVGPCAEKGVLKIRPESGGRGSSLHWATLMYANHPVPIE